MKKLFVVFALFCIGKMAIAQSNCGTGCVRLSIQRTVKTDYGVRNSSVFEITNKLPGAVKVALYIKRTDGDVRNEGYSDPIQQGQTAVFHYNIDNVDSYCVYYIDYPSNQHFPSSTDVKKMMNYGY